MAEAIIDVRNVDVIEGLRAMPDKSVHCVVTSPPYLGLRLYDGAVPRVWGDGHVCAFGLEPNIEQYITHLVEICRGVHRVLRDDGTFWLNLGSRFAGGGKHIEPHLYASCDTSKPQQAAYSLGQSVGSRGTSGKALSDSRMSGYPSIHLCDGCQGALSSRIVHTDAHRVLLPAHDGGARSRGRTRSRYSSLDNSGSHFQPTPQQCDPANPGLVLIPDPVAVPAPDVQGSTIVEFSQLPQGECYHCDNCGACLSVLHSASRDIRLCVRKGDGIGGKVETRLPWDNRIADTELSSLAWGYLSSKFLKSQDDTGLPWRAAFALQADGWYLRAPIVWVKGASFCPGFSGAVMPESVRNRPTYSYEMLFMFAKQPKYFYDQDGCREPLAESTLKQLRTPYKGQNTKAYATNGAQSPSDTKRRILEGLKDRGRNLRMAWIVPKENFAGAHMAVFPKKLIEPVVKLATSAKGVCDQCGAPYVRKQTLSEIPDSVKQKFSAAREISAKLTGRSDGHTQRKPNFKRVVVDECWEASCACVGASIIPATVLDIFCGSGRSGVVAKNLGRSFIGLEISPVYVTMSLEAIHGTHHARAEAVAAETAEARPGTATAVGGGS